MKNVIVQIRAVIRSQIIMSVSTFLTEAAMRYVRSYGKIPEKMTYGLYKTPVAALRAYAEGPEANMDTAPEKRSRYPEVIMQKDFRVLKYLGGKKEGSIGLVSVNPGLKNVIRFCGGRRN